MKNPYILLLRTAWQYARQQKARFFLVYALFLGANLTGALHPLLFGWFISQLQQANTHILTVCWQYAGAFMALKLIEWCFHGPARIWERELAFHLSRNDKAVVSTLHRLHLLPLFDYVYVMRKGHIADEGTFVYLRQHSSIFQAMWQHQQTHLPDPETV